MLGERGLLYVAGTTNCGHNILCPNRVMGAVTMTDFEHSYCQWLDRMAAAQDRCEYAVAEIVGHEEAGEAIPALLAKEYGDAHGDLARVAAEFPLAAIPTLSLAS